MAKSYQDPAKQRSRQKILATCQKQIPSKLLHPETIKVFCLETEHAYEIKEVYDKLKIPRSNITVTEKNRNVYRRIIKANLGINVIYSLDIDYFLTTDDGPFDIISLDYTTCKNDQILETISIICARGILADDGILIINTLGQREYFSKTLLHSIAQTIKQKPTDRQSQQIATMLFDQPQEFINQHVLNGSAEKIFKSVQSADQLDLNEARNQFSQAIVLYLLEGTTSFSLEAENVMPFYLAYPAQRLIQTALDNELKGNSQHPKYSMLIRIFWHRQNMFKHFRRLFPEISQENVQYIFNLLHYVFNNAYYVSDLKRYLYISNSRSPMEMDIMQVINLPVRFADLTSMFVFENHKGDQVLKRKQNLQLTQFLQLINELKDLFDNFILKKGLPPRISLGNSKPIIPKPTRNPKKRPLTRQPVQPNTRPVVTHKSSPKLIGKKIIIKTMSAPNVSPTTISRAEIQTLLDDQFTPEELAGYFPELAQLISKIQKSRK